MPLEWRSAAAQTFVGGRITRIDGYWRSAQISCGIMDIIEEWDLWDAAFEGLAKDIKGKWKTFRHGSGLVTGLMQKAGKTVGIYDPKTHGPEIFRTLEQSVTLPLQRLFDDTSLSVNFKAPDWFEARAGYDEYISMWDRKKTDTDLNTRPDPKNPAHVRAKADRWALYGQFDDGKADAQRAGLQLAHVKKQGGMTSAPTWSHSSGSPGKTPKTVVSDSQVFAALNYGRRVNGANVEYGRSHFELNSALKPEAIYFPMDTFTPVSTGSGFKPKAQRSKLYQVSANSFSGSILLAIKSQYDKNVSTVLRQQSKELMEDLLVAAHSGNPRPENGQNHLMIEAHLFRKVRMNSECVVRVNLSRAECHANLATIKANADAFYKRTGVPVRFID